MDIKRAQIDNRLYNIVDYQSYMIGSELYPIANTAVAVDGYVLPLRNKTDLKPGLYDAGTVMQIVDPRNVGLESYREDNLDIIDLGGAKTTKEFMERSQKVKEINKTILESDEDSYVPVRLGDETPEMAIFKDAIENKHMNMKNYEQAIEDNGGSYSNDVRILSKKNISFDKLKMFGSAFDMKITVTIENKSGEIANPMSQSFSCVITGE